MRAATLAGLSVLATACIAQDPGADRFADPALPRPGAEVGRPGVPSPKTGEIPAGLERALAIWVEPAEGGTTSAEDMRAVLGEVESWFGAVSGGRLQPSFDLAGPFVLAGDEALDLDDPAPYRAALDAGFDLRPYRRFVILQTGGLAPDESRRSGTFQATPSGPTLTAARTRLTGVTNSMSTVGRVLHQIGSTLGLVGANHLSTVTGEVRYFGNLTDAMGISRYLGAFGAPSQQLLGWLDADAVITTDGEGEFLISALEGNEGVRALRIPVRAPAGQGGTWWVYVEARRSLGPAAQGAALYNVADGVMLNLVRDPLLARVDDPDPATSPGLLVSSIDGTPETTSLTSTDAALVPGRSLVLPGSDLCISVPISGPRGVMVKLRRTDPRNRPPVIESVTATPDGDGWALRVDAHDPDGDPLEAFWNLDVRRLPDGHPDRLTTPYFYGPGTYDHGLAIRHTWVDGRPRRVTVRVGDGRGGEALGFVDLEGHRNRAPSILGVTATRLEGNRFLLQADVEDLDGDLLEYDWDLAGQGRSSAVEPTFTFDGQDRLLVRLTVQDGELSATGGVEVDAGPPGP